MQDIFTRQAQNALMLAKKAAQYCRNNYIGTEHILMGLLKEKEGTAGRILAEFGVDEKKLLELTDKLVTPDAKVLLDEAPQYTPRAQRILEAACREAESFQAQGAGTEHLLLAILKETDCVATRLLYTMGVQISKMFSALVQAMGESARFSPEDLASGRALKASAAVNTPTLDQYSRNLTEMAAKGELDPVIGREKEISRLIQILSRRTKNNPCLVGEPGVGKTAIVEGLAQRIAMGMVPDTVKNKTIAVLDLSSMVAGSKYRGEFEERIKNLVNEVREHRGILLFVDDAK